MVSRSLEVYTAVKQGVWVFSCGPSLQRAIKKKLASSLGEAERSRWWWRKPPFRRGGSSARFLPLIQDPCWAAGFSAGSGKHWQWAAGGGVKLTKGMKLERSNYFSQIQFAVLRKSWLEDASVCQIQLKFLQVTKTPVYSLFTERLTKMFLWDAP